MTHPIPPLYDPPDPTPAWSTHHTPTCPTPSPHHTTPAWPTLPLCDPPTKHDPPHPCMTHPTPAWPIPPQHDPPHPFVTDPTSVWPIPPLHDPPHPYWGLLSVDMQPYGCSLQNGSCHPGTHLFAYRNVLVTSLSGRFFGSLASEDNEHI